MQSPVLDDCFIRVYLLSIMFDVSKNWQLNIVLYTAHIHASYINLYKNISYKRVFCLFITLCTETDTIQCKILAGEHFGEFGKTNVICQYFAQPNSRFTKVANVGYCKFANIFLTTTLR